MSERDCTLEDVREALHFVDCEPRDTWVQMAMAIKSEFGNDGFDVWHAWSQQGSTYSAKAARDVWKSVKAAGGVGIGTLFKLAVGNGFKFQDRSEADRLRLAAEADARRIAVAAQQKRDQEIYDKKVASCASRAHRIWEKLPESGPSPYLDRKKVGAYGVKFSRGSVVVPVRNAKLELVGLQFIDKDGDKKFLTGTPKSGCFHLIGETEFPIEDVLWIAEGYATAATVYMATGAPCVVAFDAGNLPLVAKAIRALCPRATIAFAADNDCETAGNPGVTKAREAAAAVGGVVVAPCFDRVAA